VPDHATDQGRGVTADANLALSGFPTSNIIEETTMSHYQDNEGGRLAKHRGQPVKCEQCGHPARRKARQQRYCSARCAIRARSERYRQQMAAGALENGGSYPATQPIQNVNDFNRSQHPFSQSSSRISTPRHVIEAECFDGHIWTPITSTDGVAVMVSRLRQRALVTGQWMKAAA
jgi:hypothetical protein